MPLVAATGASNLESIYDDFLKTIRTGNTQEKFTKEFASDFAEQYQKYELGGIVLGSMNEGGTESILESMIISLSTTAGINNSAKAIAVLAQGLAAYWATCCITPGTPAHGGISVVGIVNDALLKVPLFQAAIVSFVADMSRIQNPPFLEFVTRIEAVVRTIIWTVVELIQVGPATVPTPFPELIL